MELGLGRGATSFKNSVKAKSARKKLALTISRASKAPTPQIKLHQRQTSRHQHERSHEVSTDGERSP